ncbi:hypothetical protein MHYP_G00366470 [Metynnis hypsauchen]
MVAGHPGAAGPCASRHVSSHPHVQGIRLSDREECVRRQKALARCALASRSFSSPQGDLDMHRLRRALERVSFEQTVGGKLDENDIETHNTSSVSYRLQWSPISCLSTGLGQLH